MISKKFKENFEKCYNINAMKITSKQAIEEIASKSGGCDILYLYCIYVATENDHTVDASFRPFFSVIPHFWNKKKCITNGRTNQRTNGATDGQTLLQRCEDASKNKKIYLIPS